MKTVCYEDSPLGLLLAAYLLYYSRLEMGLRELPPSLIIIISKKFGGVKPLMENFYPVFEILFGFCNNHVRLTIVLMLFYNNCFSL